jgi:polyisoprenoid-binding protein YceI
MRRIVFAALALAICAAVPATGQSISKDAARAPAGTYAVNAKHTQVLFSIMHLGLTEYHGRFDKISGKLAFDSTQPDRSAVSIAIDTATLDTASDSLNNDLKSIFHAQQYPAATFKSTSMTRTGPDTGRMNGFLTIEDVTKPVILDVTFNGGGSVPMSGSYSLGFHASGVMRRSDFGLDRMFWSRFVSDEVQLTIEAEFDQKS